jgi:hypothetical protein
MSVITKIDGRKCRRDGLDHREWVVNYSEIIHDCPAGPPLFMEVTDLPGDLPGAVRVFVKQLSWLASTLYGQAGSDHKIRVYHGE